MFFDDRLATVLRQRAQSDVMRRTQFRQLLDLLGAQEHGAEQAARDPSLVAAAWLRMDALGEVIPAADRARMVREAGWRFRNPELAAHLADFEPEVASAALARAQLAEDDWIALIPRLPVRARGFLRLRRDLPLSVGKLLERLGIHDRGLPHPESVSEYEPADFELSEADMIEPGAIPLEAVIEDIPEVEPAPQPEEAQPAGGTPQEAVVSRDPQREGRSEISAIVERIEQFRRDREATRGDVEPSLEVHGFMPRLPLGEDDAPRRRLVDSFGFAADAAGRIEWAEADVAAKVIGARLVPSTRLRAAGEPESGSTSLSHAFNRRQPIVAAPLELSGAEAIAGRWIVDAQPRFTEGGSFAGYVGRFRRPPADAAPEPTPAQREADRIRQLLHELRTPVTAIQGYSEVIQQQMFGQASHEYRALAAAIASDAAHILSGFDELDRLARLETGAMVVEPGETDLGALTRRTVRQLAAVLDAREAGIELATAEDERHVAAIDHDTAEGLLWRLLATLGGGCGAGEKLACRLEDTPDEIRLVCELPAQLLGEEDIFAAQVRPIGTAINPGVFGAGFALRLARAEARAAGGALTCEDRSVILTLPRFDGAEAGLQTSPDPVRHR